VSYLVVSLVSLKGVIAFGTWQDGQVPKVLSFYEWTSGDNAGLSSDVARAWGELQNRVGESALRELREIYVVSGPGSFTGIRVGAAFAAGLAYGLGVPVYSLSSFDLFAQPVGIPVRTHLAMNTPADECAAAVIEFLFAPLAAGETAECRLPHSGDTLLGVADAPEELKFWPTEAQIHHALLQSGTKRQPLQPDYGIGPKISGQRIS
jgi:hypothetical protein